MKIIKSFLIAALVFPSIMLSAENSGWELVKEEQGVTVKMREVQGSPYKEYLTEAVIDAPLEVVFEVQKDSASYANWFEDCIRQETLEYIDENNRIVYQLIYVTWPFDNRDFIAGVKYENDFRAGKTVLRVKSLDKEESVKWIPLQDGVVRISWLESVFIGKRLDAGRMKIEVYGFADPAIFIPAWVIELLAANGPLNSILRLREEVKKPVYWKRAGVTREKGTNPRRTEPK